MTARGDMAALRAVAGRGVPGVVREGWDREGYTGYYPQPSQDPYLVINLALGPTHGRMKAKFSKMMRFLRLGLEWVPD